METPEAQSPQAEGTDAAEAPIVPQFGDALDSTVSRVREALLSGAQSLLTAKRNIYEAGREVWLAQQIPAVQAALQAAQRERAGMGGRPLSPVRILAKEVAARIGCNAGYLASAAALYGEHGDAYLEHLDQLRGAPRIGARQDLPARTGARTVPNDDAPPEVREAAAAETSLLDWAEGQARKLAARFLDGARAGEKRRWLAAVNEAWEPLGYRVVPADERGATRKERV
jgi:hypothetical protein